MQNRNDDLFPGIEKTPYMRMYWTKEEAQRNADFLAKEIGPFYGVYKALIEVTEKV